MRLKRVSKLIKIISVLLIMTSLLLVGCGSANNKENSKTETIEKENNDEQAESESNDTLPIATITVEGYGDIKAELYPEIAPNTVNNFISLANSGFYNNLKLE